MSAAVGGTAPEARAALGDIRARQPKAVHSALAVLEEVAAQGPGVTARRISEALGMPRATAYRLINLLVEDEYLVRMPDLAGFTLGRKVVELAHLVATPPAPLPRAAREVLAGLRAGIRGGVHLVRYEGDRMRVVDEDPDFPLTDRARLERDPESSALGRLLLAAGGDADDPPGGAGLAAVDVRSTAAAELDELGFVRQLGLAREGFGCIAVPIRDESGALIAGLGLAAAAARIREPGAAQAQLHEAAAELARLLA